MAWRDIASRHALIEAPGTPGVPAVLVLGYLAAYVGLDWATFIHPLSGLNMTPWNPQAALAVALLLWSPRAWWLVLLGLVIGQFIVREVPAWPAEALASASLTPAYMAISLALSRSLGLMPQLATRTHFLVFLLIIALGALLGAALYATVLVAFGVLQPHHLGLAVSRGWIGDAVGMLVFLPLLLVLRSQQRRTQSADMARTVEWWGLTLVAVLCAYAVFGRATHEQFKFFYLLFIPTVWGAARFGVTGAVWSVALVQGLVFLAVLSAPYRPLTVFELQALIAALAATGLLLGTTVDERDEAARTLRASLRVAAAGDMAAALAHELTQPLTALTTYARASQLLAGRLADNRRDAAAPLIDTTNHLVTEAARASDVVKRLRNFFRDRAIELQATDIARLLEMVVRCQASYAESLGVRLHAQCDADLPQVWLDRVQIEVVLRNLVSNALEAASSGSGLPGRVSLRAWSDRKTLTIEVRDSGAGVADDRLSSLFDSRDSSKPGGMGIGLSISRSIVEAHGGRLWAEPGPGGKFFLCLPSAEVPPHG